MYILAPNGTAEIYPYSIGQLRKDNPNTSFPKKPSDELLALYGVHPVTRTDRPDYNRVTHDLSEGMPEFVGGAWTQVWTLTAASDDTVAERTLETAAQVRRDRDRLLAETDWIVIMHTEKGTNIPLEWEVYRQALRDITNHVNFPHLTEVDWPVKP